jgi:hypothetical protein
MLLCRTIGYQSFEMRTPSAQAAPRKSVVRESRRTPQSFFAAETATRVDVAPFDVLTDLVGEPVLAPNQMTQFTGRVNQMDLLCGVGVLACDLLSGIDVSACVSGRPFALPRIQLAARR